MKVRSSAILCHFREPTLVVVGSVPAPSQSTIGRGTSQAAETGTASSRFLVELAGDQLRRHALPDRPLGPYLTAISARFPETNNRRSLTRRILEKIQTHQSGLDRPIATSISSMLSMFSSSHNSVQCQACNNLRVRESGRGPTQSHIMGHSRSRLGKHNISLNQGPRGCRPRQCADHPNRTPTTSQPGDEL